jgi:hypothetical protein
MGSDSVSPPSQELCAIVAGLRAVLPHNEHLKCDFSMKHCVMQNYEEQVRECPICRDPGPQILRGG